MATISKTKWLVMNINRNILPRGKTRRRTRIKAILEPLANKVEFLVGVIGTDIKEFEEPFFINTPSFK